MTVVPIHVTSRDNPQLQLLRKLARDGAAYRKLGQIWLEGDHLCSAFLVRGGKPMLAVMTEIAWSDDRLRGLASQASKVLVVKDELFVGLSTLESPAKMGFVLEHRTALKLQPAVPSVVLDRLQDAGNVGTILRSAAALGVSQILAVKGTAALWSPKVLRAGMGAHFGLNLVEGLSVADLTGLNLPMVATSSYAEKTINQLALPQPCAWVFGHEGQGVGAELMQACAHQVRIPQPGGEESLNVASAAAICFYEALRQSL